MIFPVTKISRMRDELYIIIPKPIRQQLAQHGFGYDDRVVWKEVKKEGNKLVITIEIVKRGESWLDNIAGDEHEYCEEDV